jgi:hypothetical protein
MKIIHADPPSAMKPHSIQIARRVPAAARATLRAARADDSRPAGDRPARDRSGEEDGRVKAGLIEDPGAVLISPVLCKRCPRSKVLAISPVVHSAGDGLKASDSAGIGSSSTGS